ncbi:MAG: SseB family protein [Brotaphodocola sp.]
MVKKSNAEVKNPKLIEAMRQMRRSDNEKTRSEFASALMEAHLLSPIIAQTVITEKDGPSTRIKFEALRSDQGGKYYMAFTDMDEYGKWNDDATHNRALIMTMEEFGHILIRTPNDAKGFVINPYGENITIGKSLLLSLLQQHEAQMNKKHK